MRFFRASQNAGISINIGRIMFKPVSVSSCSIHLEYGAKHIQILIFGKKIRPSQSSTQLGFSTCQISDRVDACFNFITNNLSTPKFSPKVNRIFYYIIYMIYLGHVRELSIKNISRGYNIYFSDINNQQLFFGVKHDFLVRNIFFVTVSSIYTLLQTTNFSYIIII